MRAYEIVAGSVGLEGLRRCERPDPQPGAGQILVRLRAASLNFRDLLIARGKYSAAGLQQAVVPLSDGAGEVVAIGAGVTRFRVGDRVAATFFRNWIAGPAPPGPQVALGAAPADGMLAEYAVVGEQDAVSVPAQLSFEAASTLPCAAVTAWHALMVIGQVQPGDTVLVLGTGGVSIFALQFARLAGARVLVTSSSDDKLARARAMGAAAGVNYRATPEWQQEVARLTDGRGVDHIVEVGGSGTLGRSIQAIGSGGRIYLIGVLTGVAADANPYALMSKYASIHGVFVGSRSMFEKMNSAITTNALEPVIDRVFAFDEAAAAYRHLEHSTHFGKIVIRI
ncbi:MAG TPA: NAD(P)-dependent alcohol dehydrogenase [Steroidobacteraceae bacterium]|jgi:NADPH:quinone reductase-like Zn-dependent oxidoreductase|nr:NAD(P)-dependent alcohol dehydrogenase [Steroidobacteraceae bacterium]